MRTEALRNDLEEKMVFLVGPRQVGKTWLAKEIAKSFSRVAYLNYDSTEDRGVIAQKAWTPETELVIFDELHKMKDWKQYLKGLYDTKKPQLRILVTGSARLETFRAVGDSLAGRYFVHHLLPFSFAELQQQELPEDMISVDRLIERGGFPEPFLADTPENAERWRGLYVDAMVREDVFTVDSVTNVRALRDVLDILRGTVGTPVSHASIARNVGVSPVTVKKYIALLEALYVVFVVRPYTQKVARAIVKEPKVYFYDTGLVRGDMGPRFENFVGVSLLKQVRYVTDVKGVQQKLSYIRTKEGREVDFVVVDAENRPQELVEVKTQNTSVARHVHAFQEQYNVKTTQVVLCGRVPQQQHGGVRVEDAESFLRDR
jgi:uncharacterized protein